MSFIETLRPRPELVASLLLATGVLTACQPESDTSADDAPGNAAQAAVGELTSEQQSFVDDPQALKRFNLTREKLLKQLQRRDQEGARAFVQAMMDTAESAPYQPGQGDQDPEAEDGIPEPLSVTADAASIPLNPDAGNFNSSTVLKPAMFDKYEREPGPVSLHRYVGQTDGVPTFANAPIALRMEDLEAGGVEVAFVGVPLGMSSGWRDSHHAPKVLRGMYGLGGYDLYGGVDPTLELSIADFGNLSVDRLSVERTVGHVREMIATMADTGVVPFIVGGDHSLMYPSVAAMVDQYGSSNIGVVHLDAHGGVSRDEAHFYSDRQSVYRLIDDGLLDGGNLVQLGLRGPGLDETDLAWMGEQGIRHHSMAEVESEGWKAVMNGVLSEVGAGPDKLFVSFDMSVLDPAYALAAGRPVPGGLTIREAQEAVRQLCTQNEVVGFEMLDVAPYLDNSYQSALTANHIMHACLTGIALRKEAG